MIKTLAHIALVISILMFCLAGPAGFTYIFNWATNSQVQDSLLTWVASIGLMAFLLYLAKKDDNNVY